MYEIKEVYVSSNNSALYIWLVVVLIAGVIICVIILKNQKKQREQETTRKSGPGTETQADLVRILEGDYSKSEKERAEDKLNDPDIIIQVLMTPYRNEDSNSMFLINDRLACKIKDPVRAKRILLKSPKHFYDAYKQFAQIISNKKDIEEILMQWKAGHYYTYFLEKITDEEILMNLARNALQIEIRFAAAEKLGNYDLMDEIIEEDPAKIPLNKVHDPDIWRRITENEDIPEKYKLEAAILLKDEESITSFGRKMAWDYDCRTLVEEYKYQLSDDKLISIINDQSLSSAARMWAVSQIKNTALLNDAAEHCDDDSVRLEAYKRSAKYSMIMKENHIHLPDLQKGKPEVRQETADRLISLAETDPDVLLPIWDYLKKTIEEPVSETRSNWYDLDEAGYWNVSGIGKKFPDKPAAKNGE